MRVFYTVHYEDSVYIPDADEMWENYKEDYDYDMDSFIFVSTQEEVGAWRGLIINRVEGRPEK